MSEFRCWRCSRVLSKEKGELDHGCLDCAVMTSRSPKSEEFSEQESWRRLGYDSEKEPGVKFIIDGARGQYNAMESELTALKAENEKLQKDVEHERFCKEAFSAEMNRYAKALEKCKEQRNNWIDFSGPLDMSYQENIEMCDQELDEILAGEKENG